MFIKLITLNMENGCDATHRAEELITHPTHRCITLFSHFCVSRCARAGGVALKYSANLGFLERAIRARSGWSQ